MKAIFVLDENVSWQSCAKDKSKSSFLSQHYFFFFYFSSLAKEIGSAQILSSLAYRHDICSETISVSKLASHPSKYFHTSLKVIDNIHFFSAGYR